ncbi:hypothetical protein EDD17DRAFT_1502958 [Pisolithus thermaeus]|nr:hypothetical protein EDD17DRAFT_1502958 [Pisolithus thermaeus]
MWNSGGQSINEGVPQRGYIAPTAVTSQGFTAFAGWFSPKSLGSLIALDLVKRSEVEYEVRLFPGIDSLGKLESPPKVFLTWNLGMLSRPTFVSNPRDFGSTELAECFYP